MVLEIYFFFRFSDSQCVDIGLNQLLFCGELFIGLEFTAKNKCSVQAESTERYSQFPLIIEKFAFVRKYMKENYGIDLEAIAKGPNDWDIQPHPEIPGNNDEDGGDDDDPWPGFDW